jgi:hypothetical protein
VIFSFSVGIHCSRKLRRGLIHVPRNFVATRGCKRDAIVPHKMI